MAKKRGRRRRFGQKAVRYRKGDAVLVNVAAEIGKPPVYTFPADDPRRQFDYMWASPDLGFSDLEVRQTTASDHLPLVATITLS